MSKKHSKVDEIREHSAALAAVIEDVKGPLADRAKALIADAARLAVQSLTAN